MTRYLALGLSTIAALTIIACASEAPPFKDANAASTDGTDPDEDKDDKGDKSKPATPRADGGAANNADAASNQPASNAAPKTEEELEKLLDDCLAKCKKTDEACAEKCFDEVDAAGGGGEDGADGADGADDASGCCVGAQFFTCPDDKTADACTDKSAPGCKRDSSLDAICAE